jgi:hypothetical protein
MKVLVNGATISEHIKYRNTDEYELKKELGKLENLLNHLKKHRRLYFKLVLIVGMMISSGYINPVFAMAVDVNQAIERINTLGNELLRLTRVIGYWTVLLITAKDCIKEALNGDRRNVSNAIVKGLIIMATLYFLPEMFALMESIVSK